MGSNFPMDPFEEVHFEPIQSYPAQCQELLAQIWELEELSRKPEENAKLDSYIAEFGPDVDHSDIFDDSIGSLTSVRSYYGDHFSNSFGNYLFSVTHAKNFEDSWLGIQNSGLQKIICDVLGEDTCKALDEDLRPDFDNVLLLNMQFLMHNYQKLKEHLLRLAEETKYLPLDTERRRDYFAFRSLVIEFLLNRDVLSEVHNPLSRSPLPLEYWQDMQRRTANRDLDILERWMEIHQWEQQGGLANCPLTRGVLRNSRKSVQRHFLAQRDRLRDSALLVFSNDDHSDLFDFASRIELMSEQAQWRLGIKTIRGILNGLQPPYTLEQIISCLMVAESMRLLGEEKGMPFVSRDQFFNDFRFWRRLIPAEAYNLSMFDKTAYAIWGIKGLESTDPCTISSSDHEVVLPFLRQTISSFVSNIADYILGEEYRSHEAQCRHTFGQNGECSTTESPITGHIEYQWTHLEQKEPPPPIESFNPPEIIKKLDPVRPEIALIMSTAVFAVIFAFMYFMHLVSEQEIKAFQNALANLSGLWRHLIILSIYLGIYAPVHVEPSSAPKSSGNRTCEKCGKVFSSTSNLGKHWRSKCGSNQNAFRCRFQGRGCTRTCNRGDNMKLHENTCRYRPVATHNT